MALRTGVGSFIALWNVALFMSALAIINLPTRNMKSSNLGVGRHADFPLEVS